MSIDARVLSIFKSERGNQVSTMMGVTEERELTLLPASLKKLVHLINSHKESMTPQKARELMLEAKISERDVVPWADFGHPDRDGYGRKMVYHGGFFEIMVMSWVPGDFSSIHDHGTAQWGAVQSMGSAEHAVFEMREGRLVTRARNGFNKGTVNAVTHDLIHQMGNVDQKPFNSLHLYGSYDHNGEITGDSRIFDLYERKVQYTTGGVFFCLPESDISDRTPGVEADYATTQRHHVEMLLRIHRCLPSLGEEAQGIYRERAKELLSMLLAPHDSAWMQKDLASLRDEWGNIRDITSWEIFWHEIHRASKCKAEMQLIYG